MQKSTFSTVVKLAVISLLVGMVLAFFDITPQRLLENLGSTVIEIYRLILRFLRWALEYILIGAVVVLPIWLALYLVRVARKKAKKE
ncbi:MAG: DUF6460 domain-containing protein [Alphaproteobacteria bacterium]